MAGGESEKNKFAMSDEVHNICTMTHLLCHFFLTLYPLIEVTLYRTSVMTFIDSDMECAVV
jgi:hypothetical protein